MFHTLPEKSHIRPVTRAAFIKPVILAAVVLAAVVAWSGLAVLGQSPNPTSDSPSKTPDAKIEADVLKALAGASDLANQPITTTTVYGTVTLSGSVETEAQRTEAETIASRTAGVQKVVDELTLGSLPADAQAPVGSRLPNGSQETNPTLQSDGTMAPPQEAQPNASAPTATPAGSATPEPGQPHREPQHQSQGQYPQPPAYGPPPPQRGYPQGNPGYGGSNYGGQMAGVSVTVPSGAMIRIRINQALDSGRTQPGTTFDGTVVNDVVADGSVAIPRGATVQGTVIDAKKSGVLAGRGEMSLQLTQVILGGRSYPIASDVWAHNGGDKTIQSVNSTAIGTGVGALFGAAAGGGVGAAIGAGVGGALGLGASAASGSGQVYIPSEGMLTFHLGQPVTVATVSQEEMNRLAQGAGSRAEPMPIRRRYYPYAAPYPYPYPYYGPVYYRPYYPYPY